MIAAMPRTSAPTTPAALLDALAAQPKERVALFVAALTGPGRKAVEAALSDDAMLRRELRAAYADVDGLERGPWLVQYAKRVDLREAAPDLLRIAKADLGTRSEQAAQVLLAFGDRKSLEGLAAEIEKCSGAMQSLCLEALFSIDARGAWKRLSRSVAGGGDVCAMTLWHLVESPSIVAEDPRWIDTALEALRTKEGAEPARALLAKALTPTARRARFGGAAVAVVSAAPSRAALDDARATIEARLAKLPRRFSRPGPETKRRLAAIERIVGRVPPLVRAFLERVDGFDVRGAKPRDRVVLFGTRVVLAEARKWDREHSPRRTPRALVPPFLWPVAPDGFTKAGTSGGPDYAFECPTDADDPTIVNAPKKPTFMQLVMRAARRAQSAPK
jgi:hypothetical protein